MTRTARGSARGLRTVTRSNRRAASASHTSIGSGGSEAGGAGEASSVVSQRNTSVQNGLAPAAAEEPNTATRPAP